jgi:NADH pyrophosphatase NudC (nudix superfamily)
MTEYIKRTAVFEQFDNADADVCETDDFGGVDYGFGMKNIKELINAIPAADVAPVVHGEWLEYLDEMKCSACKRRWNYCDNDTNTFNFCPNCGAKMDGGDNDATD